MIGVCSHEVSYFPATHWDLCHLYVQKYTKENPRFGIFQRKNPHNYDTGNAVIDYKYISTLYKSIHALTC